MTDIIISFDTEDYTSNRAADGIVDAARLLRQEGVRGCFCMVGLLAKQLAVWDRSDVWEELKYHEVDYHSYGHTMHPCINEYTNVEDYQTAYNEFIRQETDGLAKVRALNGISRIHAAVPPGPNESYVAMYGYHDLGIPCYATQMVDSPNGKIKFFCNNLSLYYYVSFEKIVEQNLLEDPSFLDQLANREHVIIYTHPNRWMYRDFADCYNFNGENRNSKEWLEADPMTKEERDHFRSVVQEVLKRLKGDSRFRLTTYEEMNERYCRGARILKKEDMGGIHQQLLRELYPVTQPVSLCISDIFLAAVKFLKGESVAVAGRVYGFLEEPYAITEPVTVCANEIREAANKLCTEGFLPEFIMVGKKKLGPADFLYAMLATLDGEEEVCLLPRRQNIDLSGFDLLADPPMAGWLFPSEFQAEILVKRMPLQAWTIRFV